MRTIHAMLLFLVCLSFVQQLYAEDPVSADTVKYYFNPVVVTATKIAGAQRELAASITTIDAELLKMAQSDAVLEMLSTHVPGLYVTEWGVMGFGVAGAAAGKISIRGLGGSADTHVLLLRNGRPDFMGLMGCSIGDEFVTEGVEKIEVIRGPASFLYGTNATAGVINIVTKEVEEGFNTRFSGGVGSYASQRLHATHGGRVGPLNYNLAFSRKKTDGHREDANSAYNSDHFSAHVGYAFDAATKIDVNGTFADVYLFDPGPLSAPSKNNWYDIARWGGDITVFHTSRLGDSYLKVHGNFGEHRFFDGWYSYDRMLGMLAYHNIALAPGNTTTLGFDVKRYGGNAESTVTNTNYGEYYLTEYAPYFHTQQLFWERLLLSAGVRLEHSEIFGEELVPKFGAVYHLGPATSVRGSIAKGFRSPSIRELYFFPPHNPDLQPDRMWNYEVGITRYFGERLKCEVTVFHSRGENMIINARNAAPPPFYQLSNTGDFKNSGYELMVNWLPLGNLELGGSWSYVDMEKEIPNAPGAKLTGYVTYRFGKVMLSGNVLSVRDWISRDAAMPVPNTYRMDNYTLVNISAQSVIFGPLGVKVSVKNALNTSYQSMYGYPMPGTMLETQLTVGF